VTAVPSASASASAHAPSSSSEPAPAHDSLATLPDRIVFFDGACAFCDESVRWLRARDPEARLHFAPLQGETAARVRRAFPGRFPTDIDTIVYLRPVLRSGGGKERELLLRSAAIFALLAELGGAWRWLALLRFLPRALTDLGYGFFARHRYRWFGTLEACDLPTPDERLRELP
jgi:predicted DCC family thiol-disulfide oxidoreductase YuxK